MDTSMRWDNQTDSSAGRLSLWSVLREIVSSSPEAKPPQQLKARLMERIRTRPGSVVLPKAERPWQASGQPGVEICELFRDEDNARLTVLVRMKAGSRLPNHAHGGTEECFVVEGDLYNDEGQLSAGDYLNSAVGTCHEARTEHGCLLLIQSSFYDRIVENAALSTRDF